MSEDEVKTETPAYAIERPKPQLHEQHVQPAEHTRTVWAAVVPAGHTLEDALDPGYLFNSHRSLRPGHLVELTSATHDLYAMFYVLKVDEVAQAIIMVPIMGPHKLNEIPIRIPNLAQVRFEYLGETAKWGVIMGKTVVSKNHLTEEAAREWHEAATVSHSQTAKKKGKAA
jgi:hypothetical protein